MVQWVYFRSQDGGSLLRSSGLGYKSGSPTPGSDLSPQGGTQGDWEVGGVTRGGPSRHLLRRSCSSLLLLRCRIGVGS